jgi:hypothetical protein
MSKRGRRHTRERQSPSGFDPSVTRGAIGKGLLSALAADFARHGAREIRTLRQERRHDYLKLVLALLPKEFRIKEIELPEIADDELAEMIEALRAAIAEKKRQEQQGGAAANPEAGEAAPSS